MKPILERRIVYPGMFRAGVIGDGIEENFDVLLVSGGDQVAIVLHSCQMGIDGVEIDGSVAVIILCGAIFQYRREPERGDA